MSRPSRSMHHDWLRLVEVAGPFLTVSVLEEAGYSEFPVLRDKKRELSRLYENWVDASGRAAAAAFDDWFRAVLEEGLEFLPDELVPGSSWSVQQVGGSGSFSPDLAFVDRADGGKPLLFIARIPADADPLGRDSRSEWPDSPAEKTVALCRHFHVRLGLVTNGEKWVLVNAPEDTANSLSGTVTWLARLWFQEEGTLYAFLSLLGRFRFLGDPRTTLPALLDESLKHTEEVTDTLGRQVRNAVEILIAGLDRADRLSGRTLLRGVEPEELYEASLTVMMRLVFLLCAEERGLLLYGEPAYDDVYAASTLRRQLEEDADRHGSAVLERRFDAWSRLLALFRAVWGGVSHPNLLLPAMGGSLFDPDRYPWLEGRTRGAAPSAPAVPPAIDNRTILCLLDSLQLLEQKDGAIPLSFRSLDVEQIGYIYEGLLEFAADRATDVLLGLETKRKFKDSFVALPLSKLEALALDSREALFAFVKEKTDVSENALERTFETDLDPNDRGRLERVCGGDEALLRRVLPFAGWLRETKGGDPVVHLEGAFHMVPGSERGSTGTHYTPRVLTTELVERALEPMVYEGPACGKPRNEWVLRSPAEILALAVCDPAMGSGAFLVQACRYLADKLMDAWALAEKAGKAVAADGSIVDFPPREPMSRVEADRKVEALRLIAERCLYGVDVNPLAVELAKLSLWLVTLSKGRPFAFLDHNLRAGDSLLGVRDARSVSQATPTPDRYAVTLHTVRVEEALKEAAALRERVRTARVLDIRDVEAQNHFAAEARTRIERISEFADALVGYALASGKKGQKLVSGLVSLSADAPTWLDAPEGDPRLASVRAETAANLSVELPAGRPPRRPFHWALEFPEVFARGGFDAIVGNPPFLGGKKISTSNGKLYRNYLVGHLARGLSGSADLVAYFFLRAYSLLRPGGVFYLIANNTIAEGDTRQVGLETMVKHAAQILAASPNRPWPGTAGVIISPVMIRKPLESDHTASLAAEGSSHPSPDELAVDGRWHGNIRLSDESVSYISPFLSAQDEWSPRVLAENADQSFIGTVIYNPGFLLSEEQAHQFLVDNPACSNVLFPYLIGDDLNSDPQQKASRWVINFFDWPLARDAQGSWKALSKQERDRLLESYHVPSDYPGHVASDFPELLKIVEQKVKPERMHHPEPQTKEKWWQFQRSRPNLYHAIGRGEPFIKHPTGWTGDVKQEKVLIMTRHTHYFAPQWVVNNQVFSDATAVVAISSEIMGSILLSVFAQEWVFKHASTIGTGLRFTPEDCYETFPFPKPLPDNLDKLGLSFDSLRREIMRRENIGLTDLYNAFHDPGSRIEGIEEMRAKQREIDEAVKAAYGWTDIDLGHGFHEVPYLPENDRVRYTVSEPARLEILKRLAALNRERWESEEAAGLHKKGK